LLADNDTPSRWEPASAAETIPINVQDPRVGVFVYYAVLAYPKKDELAKRRALVDAMRVMRVKGFAHQIGGRKNIPPAYTSFKNEKIYGAMRRGAKRLARRFMAGTAAWSIVLNEQRFRFDAPLPNGQVGRVLSGSKSVNKAMSALVKQQGNTREFGDSEAVRNITQRVWAESLPVLHLAMHNPIVVRTVEEQVNSGVIAPRLELSRALFGSIYEPEWLSKALGDAEELRLTLGDAMGTDPGDHLGRGFRPEKAIRLVPTEDPSKTSLFEKSRF
jgi:hypothetical protein